MYIISLDSGPYPQGMVLLSMSKCLSSASSSSSCKSVYPTVHLSSTQRLCSHQSAAFSGRTQSVRYPACHAYGPKVASLETQERLVSLLILSSYMCSSSTTEGTAYTQYYFRDVCILAGPFCSEGGVQGQLV